MTRRRIALIAGAVLVATFVGVALIGPFLVGDPRARDLDAGLTALGGPRGIGDHGWLGTDPLGRDVLARLVAGARTSLAIASLATVASVAIGAVVGLVAGQAGGRVDRALMRLVDLVLAFPVLLFAILLASLVRASDLEGSILPVALTLAAVGWTPTARLVRGQALVVARSEYVIAARALGGSPLRIALRHVMPNLATTLVAAAVLAFAQHLLAESVLSYLGLGAPPPAATWGRMLFEGRAYYRTAPHLIVAPAVAIVLAVAAFHLVAEGLRRR